MQERASPLRIVSWNVNGLKNLVGRHGSLEQALRVLGDNVDIVCFQETKLSVPVPATCSDAPGWRSWHSIGIKPNAGSVKKGYSGVSIFVREDRVRPKLVEERILHESQDFTLFSKDSQQKDIKCMGLSHADIIRLEKELDKEGRIIVADFGEFVLFNVYFLSARDSEETQDRFAMKMLFNRLVEAKMDEIVSRGRDVILCGDLNIILGRLDHCSPDSMSIYAFESAPAREWMERLTEEKFVDVFRKFHSQRPNAFTFWSTKTGIFSF